eukprot:643298-Amphidinium_carterae.1
MSRHRTRLTPRLNTSRPIRIIVVKFESCGCHATTLLQHMARDRKVIEECRYIQQIRDGSTPGATARKMVESIDGIDTIDNRCDFQRYLAAMSERLISDEI